MSNADDTVPVAPEVEVEEGKKEEEVLTIDAMIRSMEERLTETKKVIHQLQANMRIVRKQAFVMAKLAARAQRPKRKRSETQSKASGFAAASELSMELKVFMGIPADEMRSRTEVTKWLCSFIQEHKLQGSEDKRYILFESEQGENLKRLLNTEKDKITYFDLQHYLKYHISSKNNPMMSSQTIETDTTGVNAAAAETSKRKIATVKPRPVSAT
jgi:chromatin remodeling complex protein RSC6